MDKQELESTSETAVGKAREAAGEIVDSAEMVAKGRAEQKEAEWKKQPKRIREQLKDLVDYRDSQCI